MEMLSVPVAPRAEVDRGYNEREVVEMSVRTKALLLLAVGVVMQAVAAWVVMLAIVESRFLDLEKTAVVRDVTRLLRGFDGELDALEATATDWARWDDAFSFMAAGSDVFVRTNLDPDTLSVLDLCSIAFLDTQGELRFALERPGPGDEPTSLSSGHLKVIRELVRATRPGQSNRGVVVMDGEAHLAVVQPIVRTDGSGPSPGAIVMTRGVDRGIMPRLVEVLSLDASIELAPAVSGSTADARVEKVEARQVVAVARVRMLLGDADLVVRVRAGRELSREGRAMAERLAIAVAAMLILLGLSALWLLDRLVLARLARVERTVHLIATQVDLRARVEESGRDEVGRMATSINTMLAALEAAEAESRAGEERYRAVVEDQPEMVCRWRPNGEIVFANRAFGDVFGSGGGPWVCIPFLELVAGSDPRAVGEISACCPLRPLARFVTRHMAPDGSTRWVQWTNRTLFDSAGVPSEHQAVGRDITAERLSEEALRSAEKVARLALEGPPETAILADLGGTVLTFFDSTPSRLDVTLTGMAGSQVAEVLGAAGVAWRGAARRAIAEGRIQVVEATRCGRTLQLAVQPVCDDSGSVRQLAVFTVDITDRLRAEEAERRLAEQASIEAALQGTRDLLMQISQSIREVLWTRDRRMGRFSYVSPGFEHIWGRSCEELRADPAVLLGGVHPEDRDRVEARLESGAELSGRSIEFRVARPDGSVRWVAVREIPIASGLDRDEGLLGLVEDVTERRDMEEQSRRLGSQLRRLARRLDEARERERKKLALWLHDEVGQLLTALRLDLAWLDRRMPVVGEDIRMRLAEMQRLIDDRITAVQQISIELRPSILEDLGLRAAIEWACGQHATRTGAVVKVDNEVSDRDVPGPVALAVLRITQEALTNVARHAGASRLWVTVRREESRILLTVADDGRGIHHDEATGVGALGILGMRERTMAFGGELDVRRRLGGGTELVATMKLEWSEEGA